jgi:hypothetical protein
MLTTNTEAIPKNNNSQPSESNAILVVPEGYDRRVLSFVWCCSGCVALPAYLEEISFKFNNRDHPYIFRDTILGFIASDSLTFQKLTA